MWINIVVRRGGTDPEFHPRWPCLDGSGERTSGRAHVPLNSSGQFFVRPERERKGGGLRGRFSSTCVLAIRTWNGRGDQDRMRWNGPRPAPFSSTHSLSLSLSLSFLFLFVSVSVARSPILHPMHTEATRASVILACHVWSTMRVPTVEWRSAYVRTTSPGQTSKTFALCHSSLEIKERTLPACGDFG